MSVAIDGIEYYSLDDIVGMLSISRQTLWRWRSEGSVPLGQRFRQTRVLYTAAEVEEIRRFANRLERIDKLNPLE